MELEGFNVQKNYKNYDQNSQFDLNPFYQGFYNMQEAALSIYEQYLSEKVRLL